MSPLVNAYYAIVIGLQPAEVQAKVDEQQVFRRLEQASFLLRKIFFYKLVNKKQPSDVSMILQCLKIQAIQNFPEKQKEEQTSKIEIECEKQSQFSSPKFVSLYQAQVSQLRWRSLCNQGNWQQAIQELDQVVKFDQSRSSFASLNKAWI